MVTCGGNCPADRDIYSLWFIKNPNGERAISLERMRIHTASGIERLVSMMFDRAALNGKPVSTPYVAFRRPGPGDTRHAPDCPSISFESTGPSGSRRRAVGPVD